MAHNACSICGAKEKPMVFRNEPYCSDLCRKLWNKEITGSAYTIFSGRFYNPKTGHYDLKTPYEEERKRKSRANIKRSMAVFSGD